MSSTTKKRGKKLQTFKEEYSKKWKCIVPSKKSLNHARCTICASDFNIGHVELTATNELTGARRLQKTIASYQNM